MGNYSVTEQAEQPGRDAQTKQAKSSGSTGRNSDKRAGMFVRLSPDDKQRAQYWADKRGFSSVNEYAAQAVAEQIRRENRDYDLPTLEIARLNELVDQLTALSTNSANLERVVTKGFESLIGLARGDSYLLDSEEDGEF